MGVGPMRSRPMEKRHDTSPYSGVPYLSPPPPDTWRRTNSDSALHQSANEACQSTSAIPHRRGKRFFSFPRSLQLREPVCSIDRLAQRFLSRTAASRDDSRGDRISFASRAIQFSCRREAMRGRERSLCETREIEWTFFFFFFFNRVSRCCCLHRRDITTRSSLRVFCGSYAFPRSRARAECSN